MQRKGKSAIIAARQQRREKLPATMEPAQFRQYVADISVELSLMARSADLDFLTYLLELVIEESARSTPTSDSQTREEPK